MLRSTTKVGLFAGLSLLGYGCQGVYTRTPLAASPDDRVAGEWRAQGETDTFTIRRDGDEYVADAKDEKPTRFRLLRDAIWNSAIASSTSPISRNAMPRSK